MSVLERERNGGGGAGKSDGRPTEGTAWLRYQGKTDNRGEKRAETRCFLSLLLDVSRSLCP